MTLKPNKLFSSPFSLAAFLLLPLVCFYAYALNIDPGFFIIIALSQFIALMFLVSFSQSLIKKQTKTELGRQDYVEKSNLLQAEIEKERLIAESYRKKIINYSQLKDLTEKLSMTLTLVDTSNTLSSEVDRLFGGEDVTTILYLFHSKTGELGISSSQKGQMRVNLKSKKGDMLDEWVVKTLQPLLIEDTKTDYRFDMDQYTAEEPRMIRSLISVPLTIGSRALGILRLDSPYENYFTIDALRFLMTIGDLSAIAIENAQLYERVEDLAIRDSLTGLYLRRYLLERLSEEISMQLRRKRELSFLMIDLDRFKQYNDQFGHMAGDIVLKTVGTILQGTFKDPGNLVCRYGGEEFVVLLPDCAKPQAAKIADELRKKIKKQEIILRKQATNITVSIGIATFPEDAQVKAELIQKADNALYEAKSKGRDRVCSS